MSARLPELLPALWSSASYEPHLLSLPFALAPAAMLVVIAYAKVMRGAPALRGFLLAHGIALLPYATTMMLSPSITSPAVAEQLFRIAAAFIPVAGATGTGFQLALLGGTRRHRALAWIAVASTAVWIYVGATSDALIDGVRRMSGFWYGDAGPWVWLALIHTLAVTIPGFLALGYAALTRPPSNERRQLRAALVATSVTYAGLIDVSLAYGVGVVPLGWLLSGLGCLLVVRALVVGDLLRVRAVDTAVPLLIVYFTFGALLAWVALTEVGAPLPWPLTALAVMLCFAAVRVSVAAVSLVSGGARGGKRPLERLLAQLVSRARAMTAAPAIAQLAIEVIQLALGLRTRMLLASQDDWGWSTQTGERLDDARAPDPLLASWLAEQPAVFADDLEAVPEDLRALVVELLASHGARALIPVASADELLGVVLVPVGTRRLRGAGLAFLGGAAGRVAEALLHARLALRAAERAALAREVELAAAVQGELLPGAGTHVHGALTVVGSWQPATRCAGDFWTVMALGAPAGDPQRDPAAARTDARPVLIAIGDVTGHGVASAMVTAAAIGACDACARRRGGALDLAELVAALDAAVRCVGGGELAMTCFVAIFDPAARELRFASCGHPAPYLCRAAAATPADPASDPAHATPEARIELHALVGRGNPLGTGQPIAARVQRRALHPGDLVVWYTDGVVEAQDPAGIAFGDRKLQHLLKKLDRRRLAPVLVHDLVQHGVAAHRAGRALADDETLVVAQLAREAAP
jgi:serine phosphatase RsbU (regulator of sigma subunit)